MSDFNLVVRPEGDRAVKGLSAVGLAFRRALVSQLHPKMIAALFLPFIIAVLGAILLLWIFWTPLTHWLDAQAAGWDYINNIDQWMLAIGLFSLKLYLVSLLAIRSVERRVGKECVRSWRYRWL